MGDRTFESRGALAIILGASRYPRAPRLARGRAFSESAASFLEYLIDSEGMGLPSSNVLDLFDDARSTSQLLEDAADFLSRANERLKSNGFPARDLLIYYVGHGGFARSGQDYFLAVRSTNEANEGATSLR